MKDSITKQKNKEKKSSNITNSPIKTKMHSTENKLTTNKVNKKRLVKKGSVGKQIPSKFYKLEFFKDKESDDLNKSEIENDYKKYHPFNSDKKIIQNSVSKYLITKILEVNSKDSLLKKDSLNFFLNQKEDSYSNYINSLRSNKVSTDNNPTVIEYKDESKISSKKNENNKKIEIFIKNKNNKQDISNNKNNINDVCKSGTQDFRKHKNIKLESSNSFTDHQSENEFKYNSSITENFRSHLTKACILFGLHQISEGDNKTNRVFSQNNILKIPTNRQNNNNEIKYGLTKKRKEIAQNIMKLDLIKLKKEVYEYENTDVTDAINRLPTHKFDSDKNNNNKNKHIIKHFKTKNNKGKKNKKNKKSIKNIKERFRILRRVKYVYDSLDDEEYEDEENKNFYFEPNGNFILILDCLILITSFFYLVFFPIHLSISPFNEKNLIKELFFNFVDITFIIDFISGFFTAYINFDEDLIKNSVLIIKNYLKTWFLLDFLCGIPVYSIFKVIQNKFEENNYIENFYFNYNGRNLYHLFELIKLLKIIKAIKANIASKKIKHKIKKINFFYYWGDFLKQVFIFISILNLSSCLFIFSARNSYPNWILNLNMNINNYISIYICSFYYIIMTVTTVGYGDIRIYSMTERIFEILFSITGTCLYSWMLTSASNYIKKMSEKNIKFEQKKEILDDIKTNYPLMSNDLYRRIYKLLYYKKSHQEVDKNIIINSLPYSIRNDLLTQMYNPIITNFKFFRYFRNSEFIIEIVSVLKPLVSVKGDLLLNEGDYVEDIIFNKSGVLSLEIFIDLNNPCECIKQYLAKYNLENIKNKKNLDNTEFNSAYSKNSFNSSYYSKNSFNFSKMNNSINKPNDYKNFILNTKDEKPNLNKDKKNKKKYRYLNILNIRKKEHFGDVLMFLNEPSPLNVRVTSKNAEILLLSKMDVVKISSNFPNIWKCINENSIFNLEQIRNLIMRKLSIFCYSNDIKIKSLYYKKDTKTGQNKINYSLITIPDSAQEAKLTRIINLNEINGNKFKDSENNSSQNFENSNENNTYTINEVQSSEENGGNSMLTQIFRYSYENSPTSKKKTSIKTSDSINLLNQKESIIVENTNNKKNKRYSCKSIKENHNELLSHSRSVNNINHKKNSSFSNKYLENSIKENLLKVKTNIDNIINNEISSKNFGKTFISNSPIMKKAFNSGVISIPKEIKKYQNFAEKSKVNKRLLSIPLFNFMQNYNSISSNHISEFINDEIYPHENFEIKIPDNDQSLIINNNIDSQEKSFSNCPYLTKNLLISGKKNPIINIIKEEEKHINVSNNLSNKFKNLKISSITGFEIKSSYVNINKFTENRFISDNSLIKKTKIFLSKECGLLNDMNTKFSNISNYSPIHKRLTKSKSTIKLSKCIQSKKFYDYNNSNLSVINSNGINSPLPFSKELKNLGFTKIKKDNEKLLDTSLNKSFANIQRNSTIKEKSILFNVKNSTNLFSSISPKRGKRKVDTSFDNIMNLKSRNKLDLITENMKRDSQNLNNPNEFYADLFNSFYYKQKIIKKESKLSVPKIKLTQEAKEKKSSEESEN